MNIEIIPGGNLLESDCPVIVHQVNCLGVMGAGVAKQIKDKWPWVFEQYKSACDFYKNDANALLGKVIFTFNNIEDTEGFEIMDEENVSYFHPPIVANCFAQDKIANLYNKGRQTNYPAFRKCMQTIYRYVYYFGCSSVGFPYLIGCGLAGGDWKIVMSIIEEEFKDYNGTLKFYDYNNESLRGK